MKCMKTEEAVGQVLCHDMTQIIRGVTKDAVFRKGHVIREGKSLIGTGGYRLMKITMNSAVAEEKGMVCGGSAVVLLEDLPAGGKK